MRPATLIFALLLTLPLCAQDKPAATTNEKPAATTEATTTEAKPADAKPVSTTLVVLGKKDAIVSSLQQADYTLKADGKPQTITSFEPIGDKPLIYGVLFDTSHSSQATLDDERDATAIFLNKSLSSGNKAFVVEFASQVQLATDVTDQTGALQAGLKSLKITPPTPLMAVSVPDNSGHGNDNVIKKGQTLYDAIFLSTDEVTKKYPTRRVLIVFSNGIDRNSKETLEAALEAAQRADTVIYGIYIEPEVRRDTQQQQDRHTAGSNPSGSGGSNNGNCSSRGNYPSGSGGGIPGVGYPGGGYPSSPGTGGNCSPSQKPTGVDHKPFVDGHSTLDRIAGETGGRVFDVGRHDTVEKAFDEIAADLHAQYRVTFTPKDLDTTRDHYHQIDLNPVGALAKQKPMMLFRDGFYTGDSVRF